MLNWLKFWVPRKIFIKREEDYHTHYVGQTKDGRQFFGCYTFVFPDGKPFSRDTRRDYVVLYLFDKSGSLITAKHWYAGTADQTNDVLKIKKMQEFINELGTITYENIKIKRFQISIDGYIFGLIRNKNYNALDLEPSSTISFRWPWNGEYDT